MEREAWYILCRALAAFLLSSALFGCAALSNPGWDPAFERKNFQEPVKKKPDLPSARNALTRLGAAERQIDELWQRVGGTRSINDLRKDGATGRTGATPIAALNGAALPRQTEMEQLRVDVRGNTAFAPTTAARVEQAHRDLAAVREQLGTLAADARQTSANVAELHTNAGRIQAALGKLEDAQLKTDAWAREVDTTLERLRAGPPQTKQSDTQLPRLTARLGAVERTIPGELRPVPIWGFPAADYDTLSGTFKNCDELTPLVHQQLHEQVLPKMRAGFVPEKVEGFADPQPFRGMTKWESDALNLACSERRARAVAAYLDRLQGGSHKTPIRGVGSTDQFGEGDQNRAVVVYLGRPLR